MENIFVERLRRSLKYEEIYLKAYDTVKEAKAGIGRYINFYNHEGRHQALGYKTGWEVHNEVDRQRRACQLTISCQETLASTSPDKISKYRPDNISRL